MLSQNHSNLAKYYLNMVKFVTYNFDIELSNFTREKNEACWSCGNDGKTLRCSMCRVAFYCSKDCQKTDWKKMHKEMYVEHLRQ